MRFLQNFSLRVVVLTLAVVFCFVLVAPAQAALINPPVAGQTFPDLFVGCAGCVPVASLAPQTVLSSNGNWSGTLVTSVMFDPAAIAGVRAGGGLDFFYQISNNSPCIGCTSGPDTIGRFTAISFLPAQIPGGLLVDIGINGGAVPLYNPAGSAMPGLVDRVPPGDTIGWGYATPGSVALTPGTTSIIMEIATNALNYTVGHASALDGGTANYLAFQPASGVPEPGTTLLIGAGMLALASLRRIRRS
jgi:hypothetical protein